jgi:hypothetical protein
MATRYWVGGNGTWNSSSTTNWSATSGGAGGASAPTATDDVVFDTGSGGGATTYYYVSVITGATCQNMSVSRASTILGVIFQTGASGVCSIAITGSFAVLTVNCVFAATSGGNTVDLKFIATTSGKTISTVAGASNLSSMTFDGVGGVWSFSNGITTSTTDTVTLTRGELNLNSFALSTGGFTSSNSNTRILTFGTSGEIILTGLTTGTFNCATSTNLTINFGAAASINYNRNNVTFNFYGGNKVWPTISTNTATVYIYGSNTFGSGTTYASDFGAGAALYFEQGQTQTFVSGLTFPGTVGSNILIRSTLDGTQATISMVAGRTFTGTYLNIKDSNATGGTTWLATNSIDSGNNTGWSIPVASRGSMMMFC